MNRNDAETKAIVTKLDEFKILLEQVVAINLYANGATQDEIVENMHISKTKVNAYVKGMKVAKQK